MFLPIVAAVGKREATVLAFKTEAGWLKFWPLRACVPETRRRGLSGVLTNLSYVYPCYFVKIKQLLLCRLLKNVHGGSHPLIFVPNSSSLSSLPCRKYTVWETRAHSSVTIGEHVSSRCSIFYKPQVFFPHDFSCLLI